MGFSLPRAPPGHGGIKVKEAVVIDQLSGKQRLYAAKEMDFFGRAREGVGDDLLF